MTSNQFDQLKIMFEKHCADTEVRLRRLERWMWLCSGGIGLMVFLIQQNRIQL